VLLCVMAGQDGGRDTCSAAAEVTACVPVEMSQLTMWLMWPNSSPTAICMAAATASSAVHFRGCCCALCGVAAVTVAACTLPPPPPDPECCCCMRHMTDTTKPHVTVQLPCAHLTQLQHQAWLTAALVLPHPGTTGGVQVCTWAQVGHQPYLQPSVLSDGRAQLLTRTAGRFALTGARRLACACAARGVARQEVRERRWRRSARSITSAALLQAGRGRGPSLRKHMCARAHARRGAGARGVGACHTHACVQPVT
jgi:hypothetical protein